MKSFVQQAIDEGRVRKWCMSYGCTTCGAAKFRNWIYRRLSATDNKIDEPLYDPEFNRGSRRKLDDMDLSERLMEAPWRRADVDKQKVIFEKLLSDMRRAELDVSDWNNFHAMRLVIMELYSANSESILEHTLEYYLDNSPFGDVLSDMRAHYAQKSANYQAEIERQRLAAERKSRAKEKRNYR